MLKQVERADGKTEQIDRRPLWIPIRDSCHLNYVVPQFHSLRYPTRRAKHNYGRLGGVAKYRGMTLEVLRHHHADSIAACAIRKR